MKYLWMFVLFLAACSSATGPATKPAGLDPTVRITNQTLLDTVYFTWRDGQGIAGSVTVPPRTQSCTRFTAQVDSAYFSATASRPTDTYRQPWFDPATRPTWTMDYWGSSGSFEVRDVPNEPC